MVYECNTPSLSSSICFNNNDTHSFAFEVVVQRWTSIVVHSTSLLNARFSSMSSLSLSTSFSTLYIMSSTIVSMMSLSMLKTICHLPTNLETKCSLIEFLNMKSTLVTNWSCSKLGWIASYSNHFVWCWVCIWFSRGTSSLHFSRGLELGIDLLFPIECNIKMALQTNHLQSFRIIKCNDHSIFAILILNIQWWTSQHRCKDWIWV